MLIFNAFLSVIFTLNVLDALSLHQRYDRIPDHVSQGDIAVQEEEREESRVKRNANIVSSSFSKWPNGIVPYVIHESIPEEFRSLIEDSMNLIEFQTDKCIQFVPYDNYSNPKPETWLHILDRGSCWSYIGMGYGEQWLSLTYGCFYQSTIVHELLHLLGFWHEQSRPDRDSYVNINWMNIYMENNGEFEIPQNSIDTMGMPYDFYSVMHYKSNTFSIDTSKPTIIPKDSSIKMEKMGTREDLSSFDVLKIWKYYNCRPSYIYY